MTPGRRAVPLLAGIPLLAAATILPPPSPALPWSDGGPPPGADAPLDSATLADVERFVEIQRSRLGWPGAALSVSRHDSVVLARGYGSGTVTGAPIDARTPFPVGSVTKTFTALAVARLAERGRVDLDDPVETYLPDFALRTPFRPRSITVRHLLHHRSGLTQWDGHDARAQAEGRVEHLAPGGPAGGAAEYSSLNFMILGRIVEAVTGESYGAHLHRVLFGPLGMEDAFVYGHDEPPPGRVQGHRNLFGADVAGDEPTPPPFLVPAGFVAASARDMARYTGMLLGGGTFDGVRIVDGATVDRLFAPMDERGGPAMAWGRSGVRGATVLGHAGNTRTASARVRLVPGRDVGVTLLVNSNAGPLFAAPGDVVDGVLRILDGQTPPELWPKERIFKAVLLLGTLLSLIGVARRWREWVEAGRPRTPLLVGWADTVRPALDVGGGLFLLVGLPRLIGVPLSTMLEYFPDVGLALSVAAACGFAGGVLRALTAGRG